MLPRSCRPARRLPTTVLAAVAVILSGGACAADPAATNRPATATSAATDFGGTDIAWVQLMIPLDEQLLPVLDLVPQRTADPVLTRLAADLHTRYTTEIPQLKALRSTAGLDDSNPHAGHRMPGLVDADTLAALGGAGGAQFDRQVADCLRAHLEQLASLARSELTNGTSATVKDLARQVAESRTAGLAALLKPGTTGGPAAISGPAEISGAAGGG